MTILKKDFLSDNYYQVIHIVKISAIKQRGVFMSKKLTFNEKLQIISEIYCEKYNRSFSKDEMATVEKNLQITIPEPLREFYLIFGGNLGLLKCMYDIAAPRELYMENNILMIAKEYQNVCAYGINIDTQKPMYFDDSNNIVNTVNLDIEDFLIYLLAIQGTEYLPCIGKTDAKFTIELEKHLFRISETDGEGSVFCNKSGIIGVVVENDIFLSAKNDDCMEKLENESGLEIDYL